ALKAKGEIVVVTGSGPNIHEGVTTLLAELISKGLVHGVITSSAVVAHEMAGALDRVKRIDGRALGLASELLPKGGLFELTLLSDSEVELVAEEVPVDRSLVTRMQGMPGEEIIKAAGNMGYPMGLRTERLAIEVESLARTHGLSFEQVAGLGADPRTMIGATAEMGCPLLVSVPQLIGGGMVGLCIADSTSIRRRSDGIAQMLSRASVIIESGVALTQEIHDGPFETHTGHGIWTEWEGGRTYSLEGKTLVRIDLDENLQRVWELERAGGEVQQSIDKGLPKTKTFKVPFRMEMSGFARLEGSIPVVCDLGVAWPIIAARVAGALGIGLDFVSYPQETREGKAMRDWIVDNVAPVSRERMYAGLRRLLAEAPPQAGGPAMSEGSGRKRGASK
ncbi:MAG TPA: hypothetical protein VMW69_08765, partial [Spirochaetia bacterium]|nr:hypothetical protein [Spirochaetia bacterium]